MEQGEQQRNDAKGQRQGAYIVYRVFLALDVLFEGDDEQESGEQTKGDIDIKDPPPGEMVNDDPAKSRANDAGQTPNAAEQSLHLRAFFQRENIPDDGQDDRQNRSCA